MSVKNKEFGGGFVSRNPRFDYLPDEDRFLSAAPQPKYKFNIIGLG